MEINFSILITLFTFFVLSFYVFFLLHKGWKKSSNIVLSIFFLSQIFGELPQIYFGQYNFFYDNSPQIFYVGLPATLLWAPSLFLYVKSITDEAFWKKKIFLIHLIPFILLLVYFIFSYHIHDADTKRQLLKASSVYNGKFYEYLGIIVFIQVVGYNIASVIEINQYKKRLKQSVSNFNPEGIKWLQYIVYGYVITCFVNLAILKSIGYLIPYDEGVFSNLLFLIFFTLLFYKAFLKPEIFIHVEPKTKYQYSQLSKEEARKQLKKLDDFVITHKPYLQSSLTLKELATKLEISERHLSQIINEYKGQNFFDFINSLRIEESKVMLSDPDNPNNVLQILYEVGFNSKTAFYVTFKKHTGQSPTAFKKSFQKG